MADTKSDIPNPPGNAGDGQPLADEDLAKVAGGFGSPQGLNSLEVEPVNFKPKGSLAGLQVEPVDFTPKF